MYVLGYAVLGWPGSWNELQLRSRFEARARNNVAQIRLAELAAWDWRTVCLAGGYGGPVYLPEYGRSYNGGEMQDGVWNLLFVRVDGTGEWVSGSCRRAGLHIRDQGCFSREDAVLRLSSKGKCPEYLLGDQGQSTR